MATSRIRLRRGMLLLALTRAASLRGKCPLLAFTRAARLRGG